MSLIDIFISFSSIVFLIPLFIIISLLLRFTGEGEVFFLQERVGCNKKKFKVFKFATMLKNSPNTGSGTITEKNDPRILPVGKFLRRSKINELPQLGNILKGDMSLIGPRPHAPRDLQSVSQEKLDVALSIRPGLSGVASIIFRNEEDILHCQENGREFYDKFIATYKIEIDCWYFENKNLLIYFQLIIFTILVTIGIHSKFIFRVFKSLPKPPNELGKYLYF